MTHPWCFRLFLILHRLHVFLHWILTFSLSFPTKDLFKVLITKRTRGEVKEVLFFHSHQAIHHVLICWRKFYFFTHIKPFIMFLFVDFFTFIFPFEVQHSYAWVILGTSIMSCFILLRLLDVCRCILVFVLFLAIDTCCVKVWKVAHRIFVHKEDVFTISIMFQVCLGLHCFVFYRCLIVV
jgi:hypothetical protein